MPTNNISFVPIQTRMQRTDGGDQEQRSTADLVAKKTADHGYDPVEDVQQAVLCQSVNTWSHGTVNGTGTHDEKLRSRIRNCAANQ